MRTRLIACALPFFLVSCASVNSYHEPKTGSQPLATVTGSSTRDGLFDWSENMVTAIDDKQVGMVWSENSKINVLPGKHSFVISSQFNRGFGSGPYNSITEVQATLKPAMQYKFVSKANGAKLRVWAEDTNGNRISDIASSKYQYSPPATVIPIIINN